MNRKDWKRLEKIFPKRLYFTIIFWLKTFLNVFFFIYPKKSLILPVFGFFFMISNMDNKFEINKK